MIDEKILIEKITRNSKNVGNNITNNYMKAGYLLAHEHICDIIHLLQAQSTQPISSETINCKHSVIPPLRAVVLCKDCKYSITNNAHINKPLICCATKMCGTTNSDDFCSFGKRKD